MFQKLSLTVCLIVVFSLASSVSADLILHWRFDDASGTTAADTSGNGFNGTIQGDPQWVGGKTGAALDFSNGLSVESLDVPSAMNGLTAMSVMLWVKSNVIGTDHGFVNFIDPDGGDFGGMRYDAASWAFPGGTNLITIVTPNSGPRARLESASNLQVTDWQHIAMTWESGEGIKLYVNGERDTAPTGVDDPGEGAVEGIVKLLIGKGAKDNAAGASWDGLLDDVRVYGIAMTSEEIQSVMEGEPFPYAIGPDPADGALYADTWVTLSWSPGDFAASHDVYMGDDFEAVSQDDVTGATFRGNQTDTFYIAGFPGFAFPEGLVPGTTYYWRIDEVNDTHPDSPWKGDVWSFSIPPKTAYHPDPVDGSEVADASAVTLSWTAGFGAKLHTVYFGDDYDTVANATVGTPSGTASYNPGPLEQEKVYYWRIDEFDGIGTYKGDVWTFTTPGAVGNPQPANGADDVTMATILSWTAADNAASHEVYLGRDKDVVRSADSSSPEYKGPKSLGEESYDAGLLEPDTTYYWRVDEVYTGNTVKGPVWSFTVGAHLLVDDFESYTDDDPNNQAIWQTWIDGFGVPDNGAQVGYLMPPYAEQTIVHGGSQSMPLLYTNDAGVTNSEASRTLTAPRDWTQAGVAELSLWFRGVSSNAAEPLYAAISNAAGAPAIVAYDDPAAATSGRWTEWRIALQAFADQGINLTNVDKMAIGLGSKAGASAGGTGTMYIDDIRLYRP